MARARRARPADLRSLRRVARSVRRVLASHPEARAAHRAGRAGGVARTECVMSGPQARERTPAMATMTKSDKIWMNGEFVPWDEAKVHVLSHVLHYGSSVFEGIRAYSTRTGPAIFRLGEHIERLTHSAKIYRMKS